jgi:hypothetical protein
MSDKPAKPKAKKPPPKIKRELPELPKGGRPRIKIDWENIDNLCRLQAPASEIAWYINTTENKISYDSLDRRTHEEHGMSFAEYVTVKRAVLGKTRLRHMQWEAAEKGNVAMMIWLGKQHLGQAEKQEVTGKDGGPIKSIEISLIKPEGMTND